MRLAVGHQIFDGQHHHVVLFGEGNHFRRMRHAAIVVGQFTQHAGRFETGHGNQIDGRFGVAATAQHAARLRTQREHVARTVQVARLGAVCHRRTDGGQAIGSGNPGGHTLRRFDGHGEGGLELAGVVGHHHRQLKLLTAFFGDAQAHDTAAVANGQRHLLNGHGFRGEDHVTFVFTVFIIEHHYAAPVAQCVNRAFNAFCRRAEV